jgi:hypothetical protein
MSHTPAPDEGLDVVVNPDGGLTVSAAELARLGVKPGSHLRLVSDVARSQGERRSARGILAGTMPPEVVRDFIEALDEAKAERRAFYGASQ